MCAVHIFISNKWSKKLERCLLTANNTTNQNPLNCCHHVISDKKKGRYSGQLQVSQTGQKSVNQTGQKVLTKQEVTETSSFLKGQYA